MGTISEILNSLMPSMGVESTGIDFFNGLSNMVVDSTILGRPFQIKAGVVNAAGENVVNSLVIRLSFPVTNEVPKQDVDPPSHAMGQQTKVFA